jgi:hypothetical protein
MENKSYLTARFRKEASAPVRDHLIEDFLFDRVDTVLDFGCGKGVDARILEEEEGFTVSKYDPHFFPERPEGLFDAVLCNYVLCVIEEKDQQAIIDDAMSFVKPGSYGYFVVRRDKKNLNGWTSRHTFQRLVELSEDDGFELWHEESGRYAIYRKKQEEGMVNTTVKFTMKIRDEENPKNHEFKEGHGVGVLFTCIATFSQTPEEAATDWGKYELALGVDNQKKKLMEQFIEVVAEEVPEDYDLNLP